MMRRILLLLGVVFLLAGCGPKEGDVIDKRWKPDLSYWGTQTSCSTVGNRSRCTTSPHWYYVPADYILILRTPDDDVKEKHVKRKVYYNINIGDHYKEK